MTVLNTTRFYFAQCVFNSNIHYKAVNRIQGKEDKQRKFVYLVASLTIFVMVGQFIATSESWIGILKALNYLGLFLTAGSIILTYYTKENLSEQKCNHKKTAEEYKVLRDSFMLLIEDVMMSNNTLDNLKSRRDELVKEYSSIGRSAPNTTYEDYQAAQKGLLSNSGKSDEEFTWSDEEINRFLPKRLRLDNRCSL